MDKLGAYIKHHKEWVLFWALLTSASLLAIWLIFFNEDPMRGNVGFLIVGALIAIAGIPLADFLKRPQQIRNLARALFVELTDRVARCCFDYEQPWKDLRNRLDKPMDFERLRKFAPFPPIIYPAVADQIAALKGDAPQKVVQFYYRLAALQRDIETTANPRDTQKVAAGQGDLRRLARRFYQTLEPGLKALEALSKEVDGAENIEREAIAGYDVIREIKSTETLRYRIRALL